MILVTGAGGFIGRRVCALLSRHGAEVLAADRNFADAMPCQTITADLTETPILAGLFQEHSFEAVVHLASLLKTASQQRPQQAMRTNVGVSLSLLDLAARYGVSRFVYASSISVYGTKRLAEWGSVSESMPASPEDIYGVSKRFVEIAGESYRQQGGLDFISLRISTVLGAGARSPTSRWRSEIFEKLSTRQAVMIDLPYLADEILPFVHVEEVAEGVWHLLQAGQVAHAIYNAPSENWVCEELARCVSEVNEKIGFRFGQSHVTGTPQAIDASRFSEEFGANPIPLPQRLGATAGQN
jgi:nucleoside-diphosphate-sugar epimerase